jgi:hypothetical protein
MRSNQARPDGLDSARSDRRSERSAVGLVVAWLRDGDYKLCTAMDQTMFDVGRENHPLRIDFSDMG